MSEANYQSIKDTLGNMTAPMELDRVISGAITRGKNTRRRHLLQQRTLTAIGTAFAILTLSVNLWPAFGETMERVPGLGRLVSVLRITDRGDVGQGGLITDGQAVGPITAEKDTITIHLAEPPGVLADGRMPWFRTTYLSYPYSLFIELQGVRLVQGDGTLPTFEDSRLIRNMHRSMILDDSAQNFVVTFSGPVKIEVKELMNPPALQIVVANGSSVNTGAVYSVRTASHPVGENVGFMAEMLNEALEWQTDSVRLIRDERNEVLVEAGYFTTEAEAQAFIEQLKALSIVDFPLHIERREPNDIPKHVSP